MYYDWFSDEWNVWYEILFVVVDCVVVCFGSVWWREVMGLEILVWVVM